MKIGQRLASLDDYEGLAAGNTTEAAFEYLASGAGEELTLRRNRSAFREIELLPRVLNDVSHIETHVELFGRKHNLPVLLAPVGYHRLFHARGELETVDGANRAGITLVGSSFATESFGNVQAHAVRPQWFQLYVQKDRGHTRDLVQKVIADGCEAICVTVDLPVNASRDRETRAGFEIPAGMDRANLRFLGKDLAGAAHSPVDRCIYNTVRSANVTWKDIDWLRSIINVPLLLKGILHADDARAALNAGCDGVIVSNHGGRALDSVPATITVLPAIIDAVEERTVVLLDGGVRRGTDIVKALAYGAKAVLIGRPYVFGLCVNGAPGVLDVVQILRTEFEAAMGLLGCTAVSQLNRSLLLPHSIVRS